MQIIQSQLGNNILPLGFRSPLSNPYNLGFKKESSFLHPRSNFISPIQTKPPLVTSSKFFLSRKNEPSIQPLIGWDSWENQDMNIDIDAEFSFLEFDSIPPLENNPINSNESEQTSIPSVMPTRIKENANNNGSPEVNAKGKSKSKKTKQTQQQVEKKSKSKPINKKSIKSSTPKNTQNSFDSRDVAISDDDKLLETKNILSVTTNLETPNIQLASESNNIIDNSKFFGNITASNSSIPINIVEDNIQLNPELLSSSSITELLVTESILPLTKKNIIDNNIIHAIEILPEQVSFSNNIEEPFDPSGDFINNEQQIISESSDLFTTSDIPVTPKAVQQDIEKNQVTSIIENKNRPIQKKEVSQNIAFPSEGEHLSNTNNNAEEVIEFESVSENLVNDLVTDNTIAENDSNSVSPITSPSVNDALTLFHTLPNDENITNEHIARHSFDSSTAKKSLAIEPEINNINQSTASVPVQLTPISANIQDIPILISNSDINRQLLTSKSQSAMGVNVSDVSSSPEIGEPPIINASSSEIFEPQTINAISPEIGEPPTITASSLEIGEPPIINASSLEIGEPPIINASSPEIGETPIINASSSEIFEPSKINAISSEIFEPPTINAISSEIGEPPTITASSPEIGETPIINASSSEIFEPPTINAISSEIGETPIINASSPEIFEPSKINASSPEVFEPPIINAISSEIGETPIINASSSEIFEPPTITASSLEIGETPIINASSPEIFEPPIINAIPSEIGETPIINAISSGIFETPIINAISSEIGETPIINASSSEIDEKASILRKIIDNEQIVESENPVISTFADTWDNADILENPTPVLKVEENAIAQNLRSPKGYATGGYVTDYDVENRQQIAPSDTIPAMLSPGEFVINTRDAQKHLPLLHHINTGGTPHDIILPSLETPNLTEPEETTITETPTKVDSFPDTPLQLKSVETHSPQISNSLIPSSLGLDISKEKLSIVNSPQLNPLQNETIDVDEPPPKYSSPPLIFRKAHSTTNTSSQRTNTPSQWSSVEDLLNENNDELPSFNFSGVESNNQNPESYHSSELSQISAKHLPTVRGFADGGEVTPPDISREIKPITETIDNTSSSSSEDKKDDTADLEALAREIYHRLRQRIEIERERHGGYSGRISW